MGKCWFESNPREYLIERKRMGNLRSIKRKLCREQRLQEKELVANNNGRGFHERGIIGEYVLTTIKSARIMISFPREKPRRGKMLCY